ncbi:hypothetical protein U9M48_036642 [Paspalum notatum var. saurae]|uniref:Uncharacterized protein n=1 Tax=Paspalum notatum var. saurae TaxID=547442 RepID=A0AAQ3UDI0_PASNO
MPHNARYPHETWARGAVAAPATSVSVALRGAVAPPPLAEPDSLVPAEEDRSTLQRAVTQVPVWRLKSASSRLLSTAVLMSSFKRGARMRVGGRIGRLDKTRLPTPTPPPQEWEDLNDTDEEDSEELVPDSSNEEQSKEPDAQPEVPPTVLEDQAAAQGQDGGQAQQQQNKDEDRWNESIHRWFDYPLPFPRMLREALVTLRLGHTWVTYVGTRYRHRIYTKAWAMAVQISVLDEYGARRDIALSYAPALRHNYEAAISDAAQEALATLCYSCHSLLADEKNPRIEATIDYLVALNTDYIALAEELREAKLEISRLRAQITPSVPMFNPVYYPPRKRVHYNDPAARTYIRHP